MPREWSTREHAHRELKVDAHGNYQRGEDVKAVQAAYNQRARSRGLPPIDADGEYGPLSHAAIRQVAYLLGALESTLRAMSDKGEPVLTIGAQRMVRDPGSRTPMQLARAAKRRVRPKPMRERAFDHAISDLHVREQGGNNRGADVERIIRDGGGVPGEPWCGDAVASWYLRAGSRMVTRAWAYVPTLERLLGAVRSPMRGHVVIFNWDGGVPDHTALFDRWENRSAGTFWTVEGNTAPGTSQSDSAGGGDGVHRRLRSLREVDSFRRVFR